jgi:uncharacterized membrane protein
MEYYIFSVRVAVAINLAAVTVYHHGLVVLGPVPIVHTPDHYNSANMAKPVVVAEDNAPLLQVAAQLLVVDNGEPDRLRLGTNWQMYSIR